MDVECCVCSRRCLCFIEVQVEQLGVCEKVDESRVLERRARERGKGKER